MGFFVHLYLATVLLKIKQRLSRSGLSVVPHKGDPREGLSSEALLSCMAMLGKPTAGWGHWRCPLPLLYAPRLTKLLTQNGKYLFALDPTAGVFRPRR